MSFVKPPIVPPEPCPWDGLIADRTAMLARLTRQVSAGRPARLLRTLRQVAKELRYADEADEGPMDPGPVAEAYDLVQGAVDRATGACQEELPW